MNDAIDTNSDGDAALSQAYQLYGRMVFNICRRILDNSQAAEDATQAVFLIYVKKAPRLDPETQLGGWLQRTAELVAREGRRSMIRRQRHEREASELQQRQHVGDAATGAENDAIWKELRPQLDGAIAALPEKYRTPLVEVYLVGRPQKEVAKLLRLNDGTLRWRLSHAIERLRQRLGRSHYSAALLLLLIESRGLGDAPPAHLLPSLLKSNQLLRATRGPATEAPVSESVAHFVHGGMNVIYWNRLKRYSAGAIAAAMVLAVAMIFSRSSVAGDPMSAAAHPKPDAGGGAEGPPQVVAGTDPVATAGNGAALPVKLRSLEHLPVRDLVIQGAVPGKLAAASRMIQLKKDQPFAQKTLDEDKQRLVDSGKYAHVSATVADAGDGVAVTFTVIEKDSPVSAFASGVPVMIPNQGALPNGGRIVIYSRNHHGNYPLATYSFALGLRGDDVRVANKVDLVFGNAVRPNGFKGAVVDGVPGVIGAGACGMDGGSDFDTFRVSLYGGCSHAILDLGDVPFESAGATPAQMRQAGEYAEVKTNHVYVVRLKFNQSGAKAKCIKLRVVEFHVNDGVMFDWEPVQATAGKSDEF